MPVAPTLGSHTWLPHLAPTLQGLLHERGMLFRGVGMWINRLLSVSFAGWRSYIMWKEHMRKVKRDVTKEELMVNMHDKGVQAHA